MITTEHFKQIMFSGEQVPAGCAVHIKMHELSQEARKITCQMNHAYKTEQEIRGLFSQLIGSTVDDTFLLFPPFYTDCGKNIKVGKNVFINSGCCFQDQGGLEIGDDTLIGQQVVIATLNHSLMPEQRKDMLPKRVKIGKNVWVGAHATLLPGVTVGKNAVIAAGAVVARDVPENAIVAGVPAKVIKYISKEQENE